MKTLLYIGGPLVVFTGLAFWTDFFTVPNEQPGIVHFAGIPMGGMFHINTKTYHCDENGNNCVLVEETDKFTEIEGLELEAQGIEYRAGSEVATARKQPGLSKYTNIHLKSPRHFEFDYSRWKFVPDRAYFGSGDVPQENKKEPLLEVDRSPESPRPSQNEHSMETLELEPVELELEE